MAPSTDNHSVCQSPYMLSSKGDAQACRSLALSKNKMCRGYKCFQNSQGLGYLGQTSCPDSVRDPAPLLPLLTLFPRSHLHLPQSLLKVFVLFCFEVYLFTSSDTVKQTNKKPSFSVFKFLVCCPLRFRDNQSVSRAFKILIF